MGFSFGLDVLNSGTVASPARWGKLMAKYLLYVMFIWGCANSSPIKNSGSTPTDTLTNKISKSSFDSVAVRNNLNSADSVILASHFSPNEPIKDERTGKYLPHFEVIEDGKLNESIVQERKKLGREEANELGNILCLAAVPDTIATMCFQPRNGIFVYNSGNLLYIDICFDCHGVAASSNWGSDFIFDSNKYERLLQFYKKHGFKYML